MHPVQPQYQQQSAVGGTGLLYTATGQPVAVAVPASSSGYESYKGRQSMVLGFVLIVTGVLSIVVNAVAIARREAFSYSGVGIWCGILFIIGGAFGVGAMRKKRCMVVVFMVLAIIAASFAGIMFDLTIQGAIIGVEGEGVGIGCAVMAGLAIVALIAAIWGSALGCRVACCACCRHCCCPCCCEKDTGTVVGGNQQVVMFQQQPQQVYFTVPQVDPLASTSIPGAPPTYSSVYPSSQQSQQLGSQMNPASLPGGYYAGGGLASAAGPHPAVYDGSVVIPPTKM